MKAHIEKNHSTQSKDDKNKRPNSYFYRAFIIFTIERFLRCYAIIVKPPVSAGAFSFKDFLCYFFQRSNMNVIKYILLFPLMTNVLFRVGIYTQYSPVLLDLIGTYIFSPSVQNFCIIGEYAKVSAVNTSSLTFI